MAGGYRYYEKDGAYFRKLAERKEPLVDEVRHGNKWVPYDGDRFAPVCYGDEVSEDEAMESAGDGERRDGTTGIE